MGTQDLQVYPWGTEHVRAGGWSREIQMFVTVAAQTRFEMRYVGEERWYPAPTDEVARTLVAYHPNLRQCLDCLLDGGEVASRLARFRVAARSTHTLR